MTTVHSSKIAHANYLRLMAERSETRMEGKLERAEERLAAAEQCHHDALCVIEDAKAVSRAHEEALEDLRFKLFGLAVLYNHLVKKVHVKRRLRKKCKHCSERWPCQAYRAADASEKPTVEARLEAVREKRKAESGEQPTEKTVLHALTNEREPSDPSDDAESIRNAFGEGAE